jgi:hypothetical protein
VGGNCLSTFSLTYIGAKKKFTKRNAATKGAALEPAKNPLKRVLGTPKLSCGAAVRLVQTLKRRLRRANQGLKLQILTSSFFHDIII